MVAHDWLGFSRLRLKYQSSSVDVHNLEGDSLAKRLTALDKSFVVKITNFTKYNPSPGPLKWFRVDIKMVRSIKYRLLSPGAKHMWLWLLCEVAQSTAREAYVHARSTAKDVHTLPAGVPGVLQELLSIQWIQIVRYPHDTIRDDTKNSTVTPPPAKPKAETKIIKLEPVSLPVAKAPANPQKHFQISKVEDLLSFISQAQWDNWAKVYDAEFMKRELVKMCSWLLANPNKNRKSEKGLAQFVNSWLSRGWDSYLNKIPAQKTKAHSERL